MCLVVILKSFLPLGFKNFGKRHFTAPSVFLNSFDHRRKLFIKFLLFLSIKFSQPCFRYPIYNVHNQGFHNDLRGLSFFANTLTIDVKKSVFFFLESFRDKILYTVSDPEFSSMSSDRRKRSRT